MQYTFKRYEMKYSITKVQKDMLLELFTEYMEPDQHGVSSIYNLYYDTPDFLLIRRSIEKPVYKEKLRFRSYGNATKESPVFLEIKKKYQSVVYKRRVVCDYHHAKHYFEHNEDDGCSQIEREIDYFKQMYKGIEPRVFISYDREAYFGKDDPEFRVTFDDNIRYRQDDLALNHGGDGESILQPGMALMEIKVAGSIPLWLTHFLTEQHIYKTSFSKYGCAYKEIIKREGVLNYAN